MEQQIYITLDYDLATGDVNLNEIVYRLKELKDRLMLTILEQILKSYDDLIAQRLSRTDIYPSKKRKGLGQKFPLVMLLVFLPYIGKIIKIFTTYCGE